MNKIDLRRLLLLFFFFSVLLLRVDWARGQTTVFSDDFSTDTSATYTTSGAIGASAWSITTSGVDWGGRRNTSPAQLELTNDVGATANVQGWVLASTNTASFASPYNTTLSSNTGLVTWTFNMRQIRTDPAALTSAASYAPAFILAGTSSTNNNTGSGYAIVLGQSGTVDPVRLVKYSAGIQGTTTDILVSNTAGLTDFGTEYLSIKVTYNPLTNTWELFLRNDVSAFVDPATGSLTSQGTAVDNTNTGITLGIMGAWWQGSTAAAQTAFFDNTKVTVCPFATITTTGILAPVCFDALSQTTTLGYTATTNTPTAYSIDWVTLADQTSTSFSFAAGGGTLTGITIPAGTPAGTYTGTMTLTNSCGSSTQAVSVTVNAISTPTISGTTSVCVNSNTTLTPSITGGEWSSDSPSVATIDPSTGVVLGLSAGSSVMTYSVTVTGCVGTTTTTVTVNPLPTLTVVNPPAVCSPTTVDITSASVQTTNTGTTTKYYDSYTLALAGGASNVTTPAAISTSGIYYIRAELATGCYVVAPVTVTINTSPSFAPVAVQPTCLTNGSITFPELTGGTYTYSYSINGGSATSVTPSGGAITISVPMGIQTASTYSITVTRTDVTPNCPTVKTVNIAAIPFCVTPTAQVADPCSCNNDQTSDGSQTGTFNETIAVNGSGSGQTWTVTSVAPLVAGTAPTLTVGTVLSAVANSATNGIDDDGDGSTDEADEANMYNVMFQHTDDKGYTATIEGPAAVGTAGNQILNISNVCKYPEIIFGANPLGTYCVSGSSSMPSISLSATEATSMTGTMTFSGSGVSGTTFTPPGAGTYTITATFTSTPGTGKGGTAATPATPDNSCITKESKTTTVTDSRCTAFPQ
ncbi:MAG TPA: hypothetical protein PK230_03495 [Chitinophagales bacterium]|nr:hypothetical protein [Chitinophagales bacterium]